jgi:hypothetical protein
MKPIDSHHEMRRRRAFWVTRPGRRARREASAECGHVSAWGRAAAGAAVARAYDDGRRALSAA